MSGENDDFVKRNCTKSLKRYIEASNSDDESKDDAIYDSHYGTACVGGGAGKKVSSKMFNAFSEIRAENSLVGYDGYSRAVCVAFIGCAGENKGTVEYCWIPLDALKLDARYNPDFLHEIETFVQVEDGKFWQNPAQYIEEVEKTLWNIPRSSVTNWHSTTVKDPFVAIALPTPECMECVVFFKLSDRKINGGTTYTSLKVLVESLMSCGGDAVARNLLKFARNHADVVGRLIASGDEIRIKKLFGFPIVFSDLSRKMLVPSPSAPSAEGGCPGMTRMFLESFDPNYARRVLRPVAEKFLSAKSYDAELLGWYRGGADLEGGGGGCGSLSSYAGMLATVQGPANIAFENILAKMEGVIDKLSLIGGEKKRGSLSVGTVSVSTVKEEEVEGLGIEASDAPFIYNGKRTDFGEGGGMARRIAGESPGVMPMDLGGFDLPAGLAGKTVKFFASPPRAPTKIIGNPNTKMDALVMAASIISRDEKTKDNAPFALAGNTAHYKKHKWFHPKD
jgi:hypothetical protein